MYKSFGKSHEKPQTFNCTLALIEGKDKMILDISSINGVLAGVIDFPILPHLSTLYFSTGQQKSMVPRHLSYTTGPGLV